MRDRQFTHPQTVRKGFGFSLEPRRKNPAFALSFGLAPSHQQQHSIKEATRVSDPISISNNHGSVRRERGQTLGIREVEDQIWLVSFLDYDLG